MDAVETSGKSIDDAILQALNRLGRRRDEVEVTVLQEPSRGVRGVGAKEARVRVWVKQRSTAPSLGNSAVLTPDLADAWLGRMEEEEEELPPPPNMPPVAPQRQPAVRKPASPPVTPTRRPTPPPPTPAARPTPPAPLANTPPPPANRNEPPLTHSTAISRAIQSAQPQAPARPELPTPDFDDEPESMGTVLDEEPATGEEAPEAVIRQALLILRTILQEMQFPSTVEVSGRNPLMLNIRVGGDTDILGLLIGKRGDTLASLQLLVNLMLNRQGGTRYHVLVDAENYRRRRDDNLRSLAARVAQQVQQSRRAIPLEPMTPYERRIVHMALQDSPYVQTQSTGEGEQRRVVISLRPPAR